MIFSFIYFGFVLVFMMISFVIGIFITEKIVKLLKLKDRNAYLIIVILLCFFIIPLILLKVITVI